MPDNGIDWENRFGKTPTEMTEGEWRVAVASLLCEAVKSCRAIPKIEAFYKVAIWIAPLIITALVAFIIAFVNHVQMR